jgi:hypothetical protein
MDFYKTKLNWSAGILARVSFINSTLAGRDARAPICSILFWNRQSSADLFNEPLHKK